MIAYHKSFEVYLLFQRMNPRTSFVFRGPFVERDFNFASRLRLFMDGSKKVRVRGSRGTETQRRG